MKIPLAVTTSGQPDDATVAHANARARAWGLPFLPRRRKQPLEPLFAQAETLLVFEVDELVLRVPDAKLVFSPQMAQLRMKRLEQDILIRLAELKSGESVLDCTLGLGSDALTCARAVGASGTVVGVEKSLPLYALAEEGIGHYAGTESAKVRVVLSDAAEFLKAQKSASFDVVIFDPMFSKPRQSTQAFELLRRFADHAPLTEEMLREGKRVAKRCIVVKGSRYSDDLKHLGLVPKNLSRFHNVAWARVPASGS